eukprot:CAMPEP_0206225090 /NCGR_PEP_ID=MMETSP0047_2-20121206/7369_1 /ASSEMBLY_ACC=CAM_ASM_000192 /TAXON_ID=195065 /ORGANISM="Chroomonas mesostigmatica_cf, Strain CCMP1168" /LENGTH=311 /DNA_ID=CAMNT_0053648081 /DNA_START=173 /DNA_END=1108 /DNA_ORIENTATION=-
MGDVYPMHLDMQGAGEEATFLALTCQLSLLLDTAQPSSSSLKRCLDEGHEPANKRHHHHHRAVQSEREAAAHHHEHKGACEEPRQRGCGDDEAREFLQGVLPSVIPSVALVAAVGELPQGARSALIRAIEGWRCRQIPEEEVLEYARSICWLSPTLQQCIAALGGDGVSPASSSSDDEDGGPYDDRRDLLSPSDMLFLMSCASTQSADSVASMTSLSSMASFGNHSPGFLAVPSVPSTGAASQLEGLRDARRIVSDPEESHASKMHLLSEVFAAWPGVSMCFLDNSWEPFQKRFVSVPDWIKAEMDLMAAE